MVAGVDHVSPPLHRPCRVLLAALLLAQVTSACAVTMRETARQEIGGGVGFVAADEGQGTPRTVVLGDALALTANYGMRVCPGCESFVMFVDIPLIAILRQETAEASSPVPDARSEVLVIPNLRFSVPFGSAELFGGLGLGLGHFEESSRLTTGSAHVNTTSTQAIVGATAGGEFRIGRRALARVSIWGVGPRPDLSFPARDPDCTRYCGDSLFIFLVSSVMRF